MLGVLTQGGAMADEGKKKIRKRGAAVPEEVGQARLYRRHIKKLNTIANEEDLPDIAAAFEAACGKALDAYYATVLAKRQDALRAESGAEAEGKKPPR